VKIRLIGALVSVAFLILVVFSIPLASFVATVERERLVTALERDAFMLAGHAKETLNTTAGAVLPSLQPFIEEYAIASRARIVVTNAAGLSIASSDPSVLIGTDFTNRPEVVKALTGIPAVGERKSATLGETLVFVAVPVLLGDSVLGVVRLSNPKSQIDEEVRNRVIGIVIAGLFTLLAAVGIAIPLALTIARPITKLTRRTERLADGDFSVRADDATGPPEVRELSRSFNAMAGRLGLVIENQRHFASAASHQLRTPLTALRLRLEQAQELVPSDASVLADTLDASRAEADRLQEMVEQLLALARLEGGSTATMSVNASEIARNRIEMWESLATERGVRISGRIAEHASCAVIDGALEQIVDNYIDNALTVAPEGSEIVVSVVRLENHVVIDVIDAGPGLQPEQRDKAFERFWRGAATTNSAGTGLGLAIVLQLATASGGTAELLPRTDGSSGLVARVTFSAR
jgi:signal transduction histidine kinase